MSRATSSCDSSSEEDIPETPPESFVVDVVSVFFVAFVVGHGPDTSQVLTEFPSEVEVVGGYIGLHDASDLKAGGLVHFFTTHRTSGIPMTTNNPMEIQMGDRTHHQDQ